MTFCLTRDTLLLLALFASGIVCPFAGAEPTGDIPEIGAHQPILTVEKNVNPQNVMVVYTKADASGRFLADPGDRTRPMIDFYWLMDGTKYKPVNVLIKSEIRKRFDGEWNSGGQTTQFTVNINDLKEVNTDIKDPKMDVYVTSAGGVSSAVAQMTLGPSDGNMRIKLTSIYTEGSKFPPAVYSVTLKGEEIVNGVPTGKKVARKYLAKGRSN